MFQRVFLFLLLVAGVAAAQTPQSNIATGNWRSHLPNRNPIKLTEAFGRVYCATDAGLFYLEEEDNSIHTLSKVEGLSETRISTMNYDTETDLLLVAYQSADIDLISRDGSVYNFPDILKSTSIIGSRQIYDIHFHNRFAYLSTAFGVVVINLDKKEVKDTYGNLGVNGISLGVRSVTFLGDSIYLASDNGVMVANHTKGLNLLDYRNWYLYNSGSGLPSGPARVVATFNNKVYAHVNQHFIWVKSGSHWSSIYVYPAEEIKEIKPYPDTMYLTGASQLVKVAKDHSTTFIDPQEAIWPHSSLHSKDGTDWIADRANGLLRIKGTAVSVIIPNGPNSTSSFDVYSSGNEVYVASGAYEGSYTATGDPNGGFYQFKGGEWYNYNSRLITDRPQFPDSFRWIVTMAKNPVNGKLYLGSHGDGLMAWEGPGKFQVYDGRQPGVPLLSAGNFGKGYFRVAGVAVDKGGYVWMTNFHQNNSAPSVFTLAPNGTTWASYYIGLPGNRFTPLDASQLEKITLDDLEQKWIIVGTGASRGVVVWNSKTNGWKHLTEATGKLPNKRVYCVTKDQQGAMWLGTDNGVAIFYNPGEVITSNVQAVTPIIGGRYLLEGQAVKSIVVDGGNRKWMGTNDGIWLFDENGTELLQHYTIDNSPLPSNTITDMDINQETGELFIGTELGLVSYRTDASLTEDPSEKACIFPNPVRPGFSGVVTINCLPKDASVKITDLSGVLVYETKANGSTATWNMRDYNGEKAKVGMYLVLAATADGSQTSIGKVAVLQP